MNLYRTFCGGTLFLLAGAGLSSCLNPPDYAVTPAISFKEIIVTKTPTVGNQVAINTLQFAVDFQDGDGDLGLSQVDVKLPPYNQPPQPPVPVRNHTTNENNYFLQPYLKNANGQFVLFTTPPPFGRVGQYDGTYPRLDKTDAKPAPLKGVLRYDFPINLDGQVYRAGQTFRFEITILDRALRVSNTITTSEVTLAQ